MVRNRIFICLAIPVMLLFAGAVKLMLANVDPMALRHLLTTKNEARPPAVLKQNHRCPDNGDAV